MGTPQSREVKGLAWDPGVMEMAGPESLLLFPLSVSRPVTSEDCLLTVRVYLLPDGAASASLIVASVEGRTQALQRAECANAAGPLPCHTSHRS